MHTRAHTNKLLNASAEPAEVFCRIRGLKNFAKFTGNTNVRVSFLIKLQTRSPYHTEISPLTWRAILQWLFLHEADRHILH